MKHFVKYFVITLLLTFSTHTLAEQKTVVLDLKFVLNMSKAGKGAQDYLKKSFNDNLKKFNDMEKALKEDESDLLTKKTILSKDEYAKKSNSLRKKVIDYQTTRRSAFDKIATQRASAREKLISKIDPILQTYIEENSISLVVDKKYMLGGSPEFDITNIIVEKLNKELPSLNLK